MPEPLNPQGRRSLASLLAALLLLAGAALGHPDMTVADSCSGWHEVACTSRNDCVVYCEALTDAIPCVNVDECVGVAGLCHCELQP